MVLSLVYEVVARYFFNAPTTWAYDMTYMTYGAFFMLGAGLSRWAFLLVKGNGDQPTAGHAHSTT